MKKIWLALVLTGISASAFAQDAGWFIGAQTSTLGGGINIGYQFSRNLDIRANVNGFRVNQTYLVDNLNYDSRITYLSAGVLADFHPFNNGFRFSTGLYYNDNHVNASSQYGLPGAPSSPQNMGGINIHARYNIISPYFGWGYEKEIVKGLSFNADMGILYQGRASFNENPHCDMTNTYCQASLPAIKAHMETERNDLQRKLDKYRLYPVISFGVTYRF